MSKVKPRAWRLVAGPIEPQRIDVRALARQQTTMRGVDPIAFVAIAVAAIFHSFFIPVLASLSTLCVVAPSGSIGSFQYTTVPALDAADQEAFVSSSAGSDSNDGLTNATPKLTWWDTNGALTLLRDGHGDRMLLKRGDTWMEHIDVRNLHVQVAGASSSRPIIISSYATDSSIERPKIQATQIVIDGGGANARSHFWVIGVHMERLECTPLPYNPATWNYSAGIDIVPTAANADFLVEDCYVENYSDNVAIQANDEGQTITDVRVRGNVIINSYDNGGDNSQGLYVARCDGLVIEGNVLDHNGWNEVLPGAGAQIQNHNVYVYPNNTSNVTFRRNITARASSQGFPSRSYSFNDYNLYLSNVHGGNGHNLFNCAIRYNVYLDGRDNNGPNNDGIGGEPGGSAITIDFDDNPATSVDFYENVIANQVTGSAPSGITFGGTIRNFNGHDNIFYKWPGALLLSDGPSHNFTGTNNSWNDNVHVGSETSFGFGWFWISDKPIAGISFARNRWFSPSNYWWNVNSSVTNSSATWIADSGEVDGDYTEPTYSDPTRSPARYNSEVNGGTETLAAFLTWAKGMSKLGTLHPDAAVIDPLNWFRAGFDKAAVVL